MNRSKIMFEGAFDEHFWANGYYVSIAGRDEAVIRQYFQKHENLDKKIEQLGLFDS